MYSNESMFVSKNINSIVTSSNWCLIQNKYLARLFFSIPEQLDKKRTNADDGKESRLIKELISTLMYGITNLEYCVDRTNGYHFSHVQQCCNQDASDLENEDQAWANIYLKADA